VTTATGITASIQEKIDAALQRLTCGRPEHTDGQLTISNLCAEAQISRASFYRSPNADRVRKLLAEPAAPRPELQELRDQVRQLKKTETALRGEHAAVVRELRDQVKTYANQIQILTLRLGQLTDDNQRLQRRLERSADNVTALPDRT
jgi:chromosome segregation ATPase